MILPPMILPKKHERQVTEGGRRVSHVCPWWGGYFIDNRFRRWLHNPEKSLRRTCSRE